MSVDLDLYVIDRGVVARHARITDDNWDGVLFDYEEAKKTLGMGEWIYLPDRASIPESHRQMFI